MPCGYPEGADRRGEVWRQRDSWLLRPGAQQLDFSKSVLDHLENATVVTEVQRRALLGAFGLKGSAAHQMPATLSRWRAGETCDPRSCRLRRQFAVLDEPTNNLDPASVEALGVMMHQGRGRLWRVSHERHSWRRLSNQQCCCPRSIRPLARRLHGSDRASLVAALLRPLRLVAAAGSDAAIGCDLGLNEPQLLRRLAGQFSRDKRLRRRNPRHRCARSLGIGTLSDPLMSANVSSIPS